MLNNRELIYTHRHSAYNFWFEGRLNFSVHKFQPVSVPKEHVILDALFSIFSTAQAFGRVFGQELQQNQVLHVS